MTSVGEARAAYADAFTEVDPRPSRFADKGATYRAWAKRADAWAADTAGEIVRASAARGRRGPKVIPARPMVRVSANTWVAPDLPRN